MNRNLAVEIRAQPYGSVVARVGKLAHEAGIEAYAVGGFVRDLMLYRPTVDIDFVAVGQGSGMLLAEKVAASYRRSRLAVYENFGTASVRVPAAPGRPAVVLEFVGARRESYRSDSRKPVVEEGTLQDDLLRRDFTVNALAVHLEPGRFGDLIDPFDGVKDLEARVLRTPMDPRHTFDDDPLRMIRAARFAAQLRFNVHPDVLRAMTERASRVDILSRERISEELHKLLCAFVPSVGFRLLECSGILQRILPEVTALKGVEELDGQRHKDNFYHSLQVVDNLADATYDRLCDDVRWLRWAALLHDVGKPRSKRFVEGTGWTFHGHEDRGARMIPGIFKRLRLPLDEPLRHVTELVRLHHRPVALVDDIVTDSAVRRLLFDAGDRIDDLMLLVRADITSKNPSRVRRYLSAFDRVEEKMAQVEEKDRLRHFQPPVDGVEIMLVLGLEPGPAVGAIKETIREAILDGIIPNEHDAAYAFMMQVKDDLLARIPARTGRSGGRGPVAAGTDPDA